MAKTKSANRKEEVPLVERPTKITMEEEFVLSRNIIHNGVITKKGTKIERSSPDFVLLSRYCN